ncbi:MAG TPA: hypothetical protein VF753_05720 [Terriglobales bacterium]
MNDIVSMRKMRFGSARTICGLFAEETEEAGISSFGDLSAAMVEDFLTGGNDSV